MSDFGDAVIAAPDLHEVIFENDIVRVLRVTVAPGASAAMHTHPRNVNYIVTGGKLAITSPDRLTREVELEEGTVLDGQAVIHQVKNIGDTTVQTIQTEFKT